MWHQRYSDGGAKASDKGAEISAINVFFVCHFAKVSFDEAWNFLRWRGPNVVPWHCQELKIGDIFRCLIDLASTKASCIGSPYSSVSNFSRVLVEKFLFMFTHFTKFRSTNDMITTSYRKSLIVFRKVRFLLKRR